MTSPVEGPGGPARRAGRFGLPLLALAALACAPPPPGAEPMPAGPSDRVGRGGTRGAILIENERGVLTDVVDAPVDQVWSALTQVYRDLELPVSMQSFPDGSIVAEAFRLTRIDGRRASRWVDCGTDMTGPVADDATVTAFVASVIDAAPAGDTRIRTQVEASARRRDSATGDLHCTTTGRLEALIVERIQARLGG